MKIPLIYEDENVLVVNKPAGLAVHGDGRSEDDTLVDWLLEHYPKIKDVGEPPIEVKNQKEKSEIIIRPGIVHRLDRDTSGVLIVAKTNQAHAFLKEQFKNHTVEKKYLALVRGNFNEEAGLIDKPIGKSNKDFRQWSAARGARGTLREAVTRWRLLERFPKVSPSPGGEKEDFSLLEVLPQTGRTHQIRVHMKAVSHPIVCDKLYGGQKACPLFLIARQALHAHSIGIELPNKGRQLFEAELPRDFADTLEALRKL